MEPLLAFYMFTSFIKYPVFQTLLYEKSCIVRYKDEALCGNTSLVHNDVALQKDANHLYLLSTICLLLPSIPASLFLGSLSDVWNAKIPVLVPLVGFIFGDLNYVFQCVFFSTDPHWLLLSDLISGLAGGYSALIGTIFSYTAKKNDGVQRSQKMAFLEGAIGIGATLGFLCAGVIRQHLNFSGTFLLIMGLRVLCVFYVIIFATNIELKTNNASSEQASESQILLTMRRRIVDIWEVPSKMRPSRSTLLLALTALIFELFSFAGVNDIQYSFFRFKLKWGDKEFGWYSGLTYGLGTIAVLIAYPWLRKIGVYDLTLCAIALVGKIASLIANAFVFSNWFAFSIVPLSIFNRFISTALRTTISHTVELSEQGRIFSVISVADGLASLTGSLIFNSLYPLTLPSLYYLCFLIVASLLIVPLLISCYLRRKIHSLNSVSNSGSSSDLST